MFVLKERTGRVVSDTAQSFLLGWALPLSHTDIRRRDDINSRSMLFCNFNFANIALLLVYKNKYRAESLFYAGEEKKVDWFAIAVCFLLGQKVRQ